jgi:transposase
MAKTITTHSTAGERLEHAELERQILELASNGLSTRRIAERVGVSAETCRRVVGRLIEAVKADTAEKAEAYRALAIDRLSAQIESTTLLLKDSPDDEKLHRTLQGYETLLARITGIDRPDAVTATTDGTTTVVVTFEMG